MNGNMESTKYPAPLKLNARDLPYVKTATHLGHELSQACDMEYDMKIRRAQYIDRTTDVRETFEFAEAAQKLKAINVYCGDNYGTMIWPLDSDSAGKYFRCWNRCVKLCWDLPESTHTLFVDHLLCEGFSSMRVNVLSRYVKFFQGLLSHSSKEVSLVANLVGRDIESFTGRNLRCIQEDTELNPWVATSLQVQSKYKSKVTLDQRDSWRDYLLKNYLDRRQFLRKQLKPTEEIDDLIESLCST